MNGFDAYKLFHAVTLHFTTDSYDFFKYKGKTKVTPNAWYNRNDRFHFETLGKKFKRDDLLGIFVSYYVHELNVRPGHGKALTDHSRTKFIQWQRDMQSMEKTFEDDMYYLQNYADDNVSKFSKMFKVNGSPHPPFVELILGHNIKYETVVIFDHVTGIMEKMNNKIQEDIIWPDVYRFFCKYKPFLQVDKQKYKKILNKVFE